MSNLAATPGLDPVYQLELADDVIGGAGGMANRQAQELLNRSEYNRLRIIQGPWGKVTDVSALASISPVAADSGLVFIHHANGQNTYIELPQLSTCPDGAAFVVQSSNRAAAPCYVQMDVYAGDGIVDVHAAGGTPRTFLAIWEGGVLIKKYDSSTNWYVVARWGCAIPGTISIFKTGEAPAFAWIECTGSSQSSTIYPDLFERLGYTFGGSGTTFSLPTIASPGTGLSYYIHA